MILAYRKKTGCKQYIFANKKAAFKYFQKKCYQMESITLVEYSDSTNLEVSNLTYLNNWTEWPVLPVTQRPSVG